MGNRLCNLLVLPIFFSFICVSQVHAQFGGATFWKKHSSKLKFTTSAQSLLVSNCSSALTVQTADWQGANVNVSSNLTLNYSSTGSVNFYSDSSCTQLITTSTISSGSGAVTVYFSATATGSPIITVTSTTYSAATQSATISTNPFVWTGGGGNVNWSTGLNWSGGSAPTASDVGVFDGTCSANCSPTINANATIKGVRFLSGYSGTVTQSSGFTITVGTSGWTQMAGSFAGSSGTTSVNNITFSGPFSLAGGSFTSTAALVTAYSDVTMGGSATFTHNSGSWKALTTGSCSTAASAWSVGSATFNNLTFLNTASGCYSTFNITGIVATAGLMTFSTTDTSSNSAIYLMGGQINTLGDVSFTNNGVGGTSILNISGSSSQVITSTTTSLIGIPFVLQSTGGSVTFSGTLNFGKDYTYTSGTVVTTGSTVGFMPYSGCSASINVSPGNFNYNNVTFSNRNSTCIGLTNLLSAITATGTVTFTANDSGSQVKVNGSAINAKGDVSFLMQGLYSATSTLILNGSGNQTFTSIVGANIAIPVTIQSTGGTVTLSGTFVFTRDFIYSSGTLSTTGSLVKFTPANGCVATSSVTVDPSISFNDVTISNGNGSACNATVSLTGTLNVLGNLSVTTFDSSVVLTVNGGVINANQNVTFSNKGSGGTAALNFVGGSSGPITQIFSQGASSNTFSGSVTVNQANATVQLASAATFNSVGQSLTLTAGTINMAGFALTLKGLSLNSTVLTKNSGVLTVNSVVAGTGALFGGTVNP